jgi:hypothetical protein
MNIDLMTFALASLCTYRLTLLFSKEYGPFGMFQKLRQAPPKRSETKKWLECPFCFSMTASAFVCVVLWWTGLREHFGHYFILWCALSAVAIIIHMQHKEDEP